MLSTQTPNPIETNFNGVDNIRTSRGSHSLRVHTELGAPPLKLSLHTEMTFARQITPSTLVTRMPGFNLCSVSGQILLIASHEPCHTTSKATHNTVGQTAGRKRFSNRAEYLAKQQTKTIHTSPHAYIDNIRIFRHIHPHARTCAHTRTHTTISVLALCLRTSSLLQGLDPPTISAFYI